MSTEHKKSEEQIHYENLASYLKYVVGIAGTIIAVIASVAIYFSYSDRQSMRDEYEKTLTNFTSQIKDIKAEAKETEKNIKDESKYDVQSAKEYSQNELSRLQTETHKIALDETEKQVADIFKSDKIQAIIEKNAIGELKEKLPATIADYTKSLPKIMEAAAWMKGGEQEGADILKSYFNSSSEFERDISRNIYNEISNDFYKQYSNLTPDQFIESFKDPGLKFSEFHKVVDNKIPTNQSDIANINLLMKIINAPSTNQYGLAPMAMSIKMLSFISGKNFRPFEIDEINKWFNGLRK